LGLWTSWISILCRLSCSHFSPIINLRALYLNPLCILINIGLLSLTYANCVVYVLPASLGTNILTLVMLLSDFACVVLNWMHSTCLLKGCECINFHWMIKSGNISSVLLFCDSCLIPRWWFMLVFRTWYVLVSDILLLMRLDALSFFFSFFFFFDVWTLLLNCRWWLGVLARRYSQKWSAYIYWFW